MKDQSIFDITEEEIKEATKEENQVLRNGDLISPYKVVKNQKKQLILKELEESLHPKMGETYTYTTTIIRTLIFILTYLI